MTQPTQPMAGETHAPQTLQADRDFVRRLKQEDPEALKQLWEDLYRDAIFVARRYKQTDDMAYDAAIKAYEALRKRGIANYNFQSTFRSYSWIILSRALFRLIKKDVPIADVEVPDVPAQVRERRAGTAVIWDRIQECVEALSGNRRQTFYLIDLEGQSSGQVAESLGLSRNNVNQLVSRARREVRRCLENLGYKSSEDVLSL